MKNHHSRQYLQLAVALIVIIISVTSCNLPAIQAPESTVIPRDAVVISVMTSDTKAEWLEKATEAFNNAGIKTSQSHPVYVEILREESPGDNDQAIRDGAFQPTIWSPGEISTVQAANQLMVDRGKPPLVTETCLPIVYAATGFAMWRPMAEALGWPDKPIGWDEIVSLAADPQGWAFYGHPEWGTFKFGHAHPEHSTTGFTMLATLAYNALDKTEGLTPELLKSEPVMTAFRNVEANTYHYGLSTRFLLTVMAERGPSYLHAVTSSETATLKTNEVQKDILRFPYVFIFPAEGTFWMDNPFCILEGEWVSTEQREAAQLYRDFLLQPEQQDLAVTIGLRPANPQVSLHAPIALEYGTDPRVSPQSVPPLGAVDGETRGAILDLFKQTKRKASVVIALDTSGSMGGDKLSSAIDGTIEFMHRLATDDEIYVYTFEDAVHKLEPSGRSGDVIEQMEMMIRKLSARNSTNLYKAICQAVEFSEQQKNAHQAAGEARLHGVVVLSDGMDTIREMSLDELLRSCLPSGEDVEGVRVFTIAYGDDADQDVLKQISEQTNGKMFVSSPDNIRQIYLGISAEQ